MQANRTNPISKRIPLTMKIGIPFRSWFQKAPLCSSSPSSTANSHLAVVERRETILADEDNHLDLENSILNCLYDYDVSSDLKAAVKNESLRLLAALCYAHPHSAAPYLTKIIHHLLRCLNDPDSTTRDACRYIVGALSELYLGSPNFIDFTVLLPVVAGLSQAGAIAPQSLEHFLPSIHECLTSSDWATRKAAAEALSSLALHQSSLVTDKTGPTLAALEACQFDPIEPVRDTMTEALQLWKKIAGKGDGSPNDGGNPESAVSSETSDLKKENFEERKSDPQVKEPSTSSSNTDLTTKAKPAGISEKAVVILEKEAPVLSDKELNPEFFQKHEKRGSDDLPVEVVVPRRCLNSSSSNNEEESEASAKDSKEGRTSIGNIPNDDSRQILMQVERLQVDMMNRLQAFMDQSRDRMVSLENSVWGLERTVEAKYNGFNDYSSAKYGRDGDGRPRIQFGERFAQYGNAFGMRDGYGASRNGQISSRWAFTGSSADGRPWKSVHDSNQGGSRRSQEKTAMPIWQASKGEATLEAIRIAGEDNGTSRETRVAIPDENSILSSWSKALHALQTDDVDSAFAEVLALRINLLLLKLMAITGPVMDRLSNKASCKVLETIGRSLKDPGMYEFCLSWIQQLLKIILKDGPDTFDIPMEVKKGLLLNLYELPTYKDWEGVPAHELLLQLASAWEIDLQEFE